MNWGEGLRRAAVVVGLVYWVAVIGGLAANFGSEMTIANNRGAASPFWAALATTLQYLAWWTVLFVAGFAVWRAARWIARGFRIAPQAD